jgi:hypothetical protein
MGRDCKLPHDLYLVSYIIVLLQSPLLSELASSQSLNLSRLITVL